MGGAHLESRTNANNKNNGGMEMGQRQKQRQTMTEVDARRPTKSGRCKMGLQFI